VAMSEDLDLGWRSKQDQCVAECFGMKASSTQLAGTAVHFA
jgi:hypothetical protein